MGESEEIWSFFSGAMGLDLGLERAGVETTLAVEIEKDFCDTISLNRPNLDVINADISKLSGSDLRKRRNYYGEVFLMVGGPPCQSFSPGGKRSALSDPRGNLIYEYFRLIKEVQPKFFVFENVANILTAAVQHRKIEDRPGKSWNLQSYSEQSGLANDGILPLLPEEQSGSAFRFLLNDIKLLGYNVTFSVVNTSEYGAPQHRYRFLMIGAKEGYPPLLPDAMYGDDHKLAYKTVRDAISDLQDNPGPHSVYTPDVERFFNLVPPGGNWRSLPTELKPLAMGNSYNSGGGKTGFFRRLSWDTPAPTITGRANRKGSAMCHPNYSRPLSVKECARIQGFPDNWVFSGSMSQQYMQIGNAVPVQLGEVIGSLFKDSTDRYIKLFEKEPSSSLADMIEIGLKKLRDSAKNKKSKASAKAALNKLESTAASKRPTYVQQSFF